MTKKDVKKSQNLIADTIATKAESMLTKVRANAQNAVANYFSAPAALYA